jgi:urease accessory protein
VDSAPAAVRSVTATADGRALCDVGRHARLELTFAVRAGRTVLANAYAEPPFRIGRCLPDGDGVHLIVASSAPGVFGGDTLQQTISVERGARVRLTSQSAMQVHAAPDGSPTTLASTYRVASGGHLHCQWDPLIPFPQASLDQRIQIDLARDATLFWSDAFMAGREARGERWRFSHLSHELRLSFAGALMYLERYTIDPDTATPTGRWVADDACYFGTVLVAGSDVDRGAVARLHNELAAMAGIRAAADRIDDHLMLVRLTASSGVAFHAARAFAGSALKA